MIYNEELDKSFETKKDMIDFLVQNKRLNIAKRKSTIKTKRCSFSASGKGDAIKSNVAPDIGDTIQAVINTTNIMDSHDDVHAKSIWNKSAKEQNGKTFFLTDHNMSFDNVISWPKDVEVSLREITWAELGQKFDGSTTALVFTTKLHDYSNKSYVNALKAGVPIEHSIRMRYIDVELAVNDDEYKEEYSVWKAHIDEVVNRELAEEKGYFYYVREAAIASEGSAVLSGSNSATPTLSVGEEKANIEPPLGTQHNSDNGVKAAPVWLNLM